MEGMELTDRGEEKGEDVLIIRAGNRSVLRPNEWFP